MQECEAIRRAGNSGKMLSAALAIANVRLPLHPVEDFFLREPRCRHRPRIRQKRGETPRTPPIFLFFRLRRAFPILFVIPAPFFSAPRRRRFWEIEEEWFWADASYQISGEVR